MQESLDGYLQTLLGAEEDDNPFEQVTRFKQSFRSFRMVREPMATEAVQGRQQTEFVTEDSEARNLKSGNTEERKDSKTQGFVPAEVLAFIGFNHEFIKAYYKFMKGRKSTFIDDLIA